MAITEERSISPLAARAAHRSALPGVIAFAVGLACLAFAGGLTQPPGGNGGPSALPLLIGLVGVIVGVFLLAPLGISVLAAGAGPRLPARSGSRCVTWSATGPGLVQRWLRSRSPCSWPW